MTTYENAGLLLAWGLLVWPRPAWAQAVHRRLEPEATFPEPFSQIRGLAELPDGRVLVTDWIEERLVVLDFRSGESRDLYRRGPGPEEFRLPERILRLPGDSLLLVDQGNQRLLVLSPDLRIVGLQGGPSELEFRPTPAAIDARGDFYFTLPGWITGRAPGARDSTAVYRWNRRADELSTVGFFLGAKPRSDAGQPRLTPGIPFVMFEAQDSWQVFSDGALALVRSDGYRVDRVDPGGGVHLGERHGVDARPVTMADKRDFVRRFLTRTPVGGRGQGLGAPTADETSPQFVEQVVRANEFAETIPPFLPGALWVSPSDHLWVAHWVTPEAPAPTFDVFDRTGVLVAQVTLPDSRELLGFGSGVLYAVATDDLGLQTLERYDRPIG